MDAHDSVAYVVDDGVTAVDVSDESAPRVNASLTDLDLRGCASVAAYAATLAQPRRSRSVSEALTRGALSSETSTAVTPSSTTYATESCASTARAPVSISGRTDVTVKSARTSCGARHTSANSARREARAASPPPTTMMAQPAR